MNNIITSDTIHSFFLLVFKDELPIYDYTQSPYSGLGVFKTMRDNNTMSGFVKVNSTQFDNMCEYYDHYMSNTYRYKPIMLVSYTMKLVIFNEQVFNPTDKEHLDLLISIMSDAEYQSRITESAKTLFEQSIAISKDSIIDIIKKEKYDKFIEVVNGYKDIRKNNYQAKINEAYEAMMNAINVLNTAKRNYENTLALNEKQILSQDNMVLDLYNFFTRCKQLVGFAVYKNTDCYNIRLLTKALPVEYTVAENVLTALTDNPSGSKYKLPQESKDILKDAFTDRSRYVTVIDPVDIEFRLYSNGEITYKIYYNYSQTFTNIHHRNFTCFGGFAPSLAEAVHNNNLIQLTSILLQYLQTINLQDVAGQRWINDSTLLVLDKETNKYSVMYKDGKILDFSRYDKELYAIKDFKGNFEYKIIKED